MLSHLKFNLFYQFVDVIRRHKGHVTDRYGYEEQIERVLPHVGLQQHDYDTDVGEDTREAKNLVDVHVEGVVPLDGIAESLKMIDCFRESNIMILILRTSIIIMHIVMHGSIVVASNSYSTAAFFHNSKCLPIHGCHSK